MADRERERKRRLLRAKAKRRRDEHKKDDVGELAKEHRRDPYKGSRTCVEGLKIVILVLTGLLLLTHLVSSLFVISDLGDATLAYLWGTLLEAGAILVLGGLAFAIVLGVAAVFDLSVLSREGLELGRELHAETQFSGVMLSELAEALVEEEVEKEEEKAPEEPESEDEGDAGPPPVPR